MNPKEFLAKYQENDNEWWKLSSGDMQNLFEEAVEQLAAKESAHESTMNPDATISFGLQEDQFFARHGRAPKHNHRAIRNRKRKLQRQARKIQRRK